METYLVQKSTSYHSTVRLKAAAIALEARFLSEMFTAAGLGQLPTITGGGIGEKQFASHLNHEQSKTIARNGGFGLAEAIFESLKKG